MSFQLVIIFEAEVGDCLIHFSAVEYVVEGEGVHQVILPEFNVHTLDSFKVPDGVLTALEEIEMFVPMGSVGLVAQGFGEADEITTCLGPFRA